MTDPRQKGRPMAASATATPEAAGLSSEAITRVYQRIKVEEWRDDVKKADGASPESAGIYAALRVFPYAPNFHTDLCRCARVRFPDKMRMLAGDLFEINEGDRVPSGDGFRRLTADEAAEGVATLEAAQRLRDARRPMTAAAELVRSVEGETARAKQERDAIDRRLADLADSLAIAKARVEATKADVETHLETWSQEERARVMELAETFEARCAPAADADRGHVGTMADLRRNQAGDEGPVCFTTDARGNAVRLKVDRGR